MTEGTWREPLIREVVRQMLRQREWRFERRARLLTALKYAQALRLAKDDETRWFYACLMLDYRRMAHDLTADAGLVAKAAA